MRKIYQKHISRLVGCLSSNRKTHYVGCDVQKRFIKVLADFYNSDGNNTSEMFTILVIKIRIRSQKADPSLKYQRGKSQEIKRLRLFVKGKRKDLPQGKEDTIKEDLKYRVFISTKLDTIKMVDRGLYDKVLTIPLQNAIIKFFQTSIWSSDNKDILQEVELKYKPKIEVLDADISIYLI